MAELGKLFGPRNRFPFEEDCRVSLKGLGLHRVEGVGGSQQSPVSLQKGSRKRVPCCKKGLELKVV